MKWVDIPVIIRLANPKLKWVSPRDIDLTKHSYTFRNMSDSEDRLTAINTKYVYGTKGHSYPLSLVAIYQNN